MTGARQPISLPQPAPKRIRKELRSECHWKLGELFSYQLLSGKLVIFRVIGHHTDKGGTYPVCELLDWTGDEIPSAEVLRSLPVIYQTVTDRIIVSLKAGVIPWEKPWKTPREAGGPFPRNFYTGKPYRGINVLLLWSSEYNSPFWLTFKQAQALKGNVRKGEHGTQIIFYKQLPEYAKKDDEATGEDERVPFVLCHYTVFNVEQCDGLTIPEILHPAIAPEIDEDEVCESIVTGWESHPALHLDSLTE